MPSEHHPATQGLTQSLTKVLPELDVPLKDVKADQQFFSMVQARAARIQGECVDGRMRKRLPSADMEMEALMNQAVTDLTVARGELTDADKQAELDGHLAKVKALRDNVVAFLTAVKPGE